MNYSLLKSLLDGEFAGQEDAAILQTLNAETGTELVYIPKKIVNNYLSKSITKKLRAITLKPQGPNFDGVIPGTVSEGDPDGLTLRLIAFQGLEFVAVDTGDLVNPDNANLRGMTQILLGYGVVSQSDVDGFWELFTTRTSRAAAELGGEVTALNITKARLLPKRATAQAALDAANQIASNWQSVIAQLDAGIDVNLEGAI